MSKYKYEFKKGDKLKVIEANFIFPVGSIVTCDSDIKTDSVNVNVYAIAEDGVRDWRCASRFELYKSKEEEKLIENETKMNIDDLKGVDQKILDAAKAEVEEERAKKQQEDAAKILRQLYEEQDKAEAIVKAAGIDKAEIKKKLKVFDGKQ